VLARLEQAHLKHGIPDSQLRDCRAKGDELGKMLGGFIKYLLKCDWKERGRYKRAAPIHDS
jgi:hypothetical protein